MQLTTLFTPEAALERRQQLMDSARASLVERRRKGRELRRQQVREGLRPPRACGQREGITLVQANVTIASSWADELQHGETFADCDFAAVQEHRLRGPSRDAAARRRLEAGWDCVLDDAYIKVSDAGGGTALLASRWSGVRPVVGLGGEAATALDRLIGRISLGIIDIVGGILLVSFYGLDGQPTGKQVDLWHDLGKIITLVGLPFIILGDWQVTPSDMKETNWLNFMRATVVAPSAPTNLVSRRRIDFAVMSQCVWPTSWRPWKLWSAPVFLRTRLFRFA